MKIIDTHLHAYDGGFPPGAFEPVTPAAMLRVMDKYGVESAWISSLSSLVKDPVAGNKRLYDFCKESPDRFRPFYSFNPNLPLGEMMDEVRRCKEVYGARGIKLHPWLTGFSVSTEEMYTLSGLCAELDLPILFHDGTPPYCSPLQIASLGELHKDLRIIMGHAGIADMHFDVIRAAQQNPNIYLGFCCTPLGDIEDIVSKIDNDRLFFGTDFYGIESFSSYVDNMIEAVTLADLSDEVKHKIMYANAARFMEKGA